MVRVITATLIFTLPSFAKSKPPKLRPSSKYWDEFEPHPKVHLLQLSRHRTLASVGDTLYMLDNHRQIIWTWTSDGPPFTDLPIVDSTRTIYVLGYDLLWAAIDSSNGEEKWRSTANGRATYSQIRLYRRDMYLVVTDMTAYKDTFNLPINNHVTLCKGNSIFWYSEIPARAKIEVSGKRVFIVYKRRSQLVRKPLNIPSHLKRRGRVSVLADDDGRKIRDW
jgi:hypothetical protein